jgi:DNA modification methylase
LWQLPLSNKDDMIDKALSFNYPKIIHYAVVKDIPERFIEMYTKEGFTVLDPFGGSGTVACIAYQLNRNGISVDISQEQTDISNKRIEIMRSINNV